MTKKGAVIGCVAIIFIAASVFLALRVGSVKQDDVCQYQTAHCNVPYILSRVLFFPR